jgi:hypothetical protein
MELTVEETVCSSQLLFPAGCVGNNTPLDSINGDGLHFFVLRKVFFTKVQSKDSEKIQNYGIVSRELSQRSVR